MDPVTKYRFAGFEADVNAGELRRNGHRLKLQMQPFQVLVALLERPNQVVTREELRLRLWPQDTFVDFDHGLNTAMVKLRDVLGDSATTPKYIETIAKRGYRFLAAVQVVSDPPSVASPAAPTNGATAAASASQHELDGPEAELPRASRTTVRILFSLSQIMYLIFYFAALFNLEKLLEAANRMGLGPPRVVFVVYLVTALAGVAVRLYLMTATAFDYHLLGEKYRILFPALLALDLVWALAPLLITDRMGLGLALGSVAALIYMPFAQRVLMKMMYRPA